MIVSEISLKKLHYSQLCGLYFLCFCWFYNLCNCTEMIALHVRAACLRALYKQDHRSALQLYSDDDRQDEENVSLKYIKCKHSLVPKVPSTFCPVLCSLDTLYNVLCSLLYNVQTRQRNSAGHFYRTDAGANDVTLYTLEFSTRMIFFYKEDHNDGQL